MVLNWKRAVLPSIAEMEGFSLGFDFALSQNWGSRAHGVQCSKNEVTFQHVQHILSWGHSKAREGSSAVAISIMADHAHTGLQ